MRFPGHDHHDFGAIALFQALCKRTGDAEGGEILRFDIEVAFGCLQGIMREPDGFAVAAATLPFPRFGERKGDLAIRQCRREIVRPWIVTR